MSFEDRIVAFSERFLASRTFELVVTPALADLEFDPGRRLSTRIANRLAVIKAVAGGFGHDVKGDVPIFVALTMMPAGYYLPLLALCFDAFKTWGQVFTVVGILMALSVPPVMVCFWPSRQKPVAE